MSFRTALLAMSLCACATAPGDDDDVEELSGDQQSCAAIRGLAARCEALLGEPVFVTLVDRSQGQPHDVALLGAVSGDTCRLTYFTATEVIDYVSSLAVIGTDVFYCASTDINVAGPLTRVSMLDGKVTTSGLRCLSTTSHEDKLFVMTEAGSSVQEYANFEAVLANTASAWMVGQWAVRMGSGDKKLYSTSPMPTTVYVFEPATRATAQLGMPPSTIGVMGIAEQSGTLAILDGASSNQYLHTYDASTGSARDRVVASTQLARLHGLSNACRVPVFE